MLLHLHTTERSIMWHKWNHILANSGKQGRIAAVCVLAFKMICELHPHTLQLQCCLFALTLFRVCVRVYYISLFVGTTQQST